MNIDPTHEPYTTDDYDASDPYAPSDYDPWNPVEQGYYDDDPSPYAGDYSEM